MKVVAEIVDGCHLKCALCWNRDRVPSFRNMSLETAGLVIDKYRSPIDWYNWGEPLLHKKFLAFADMVKGTSSRISSSLSFKIGDEKLKSIKNFSSVVVSLSGMTPDVYNLYHRGGDFNLVMQNLRRLADIVSRLRIQWLQHPENTHQYLECKRLCKSIGAEFFPKGLNCEVENLVDGFEHQYIKDYRVHRERCYLKNDIVIDVDGEYLLCCASHNVRIGLNIRDNVSNRDIVVAKDEVDLCRTCQKQKLWKLY